MASLIAIAGFLLSIALKNTASIGFGFLHVESQKFMAVVAGTFLILVAIKSSVRYRRGRGAVCVWSLERLLKHRRRST